MKKFMDKLAKLPCKTWLIVSFICALLLIAAGFFDVAWVKLAAMAPRAGILISLYYLLCCWEHRTKKEEKQLGQKG